ncbi:MAG TPA: hypothetical protein EYQ58_07075 [Candidatus Poseidoniales archaeon]|nr:hypothetical protein [Candidatus Poseidoniales archaeon]
MAGRWRKLLEEESEHQWLAISLFFIFAIIGGFAIEGTSTLAGVDLGAGEAMHDDSRVLDVVYFGSDGSVASQLTHMYVPGQGHFLYIQDSAETANMIYQPSEYDKGDEIRFMNEMDGDRAMLSIASTQLVEINLNGQWINWNINSTDDFWIDDYQENGGPDSAMIVTQENDGTSTIRALSYYVASPPMVNSNSVNWDNIVHLSQDKWVATGTIANAQSSGDSPASPSVRTAIGIVEWQGNLSVSPVLISFTTGEEGQIHNSFSTGNSQVIIAANTGAYQIEDDGSITHLDLPSQSAITDSKGYTWFIGQKGTTSIASFNDGIVEVQELAKPIPLEIEVSEYEDGVIFMHGMDDNGAFELMTIDLTAQNSIEAGRGFLNFAFLTSCSIILVVMGWTALDRYRNY